MLLSAVLAPAIYVATADSLPLATAAVLAVSAAAAMHIRLSMGRVAAAAGIVLSGALLALLGAEPRLVGAILIGGLTAAELSARGTGRSSVLRAAVWTGAIASLASLSGLAAAAPLPTSVALREALGALAGGVLSAPLLLTLGPLMEPVFGHVTRLTMEEWLSYDHPLLQGLANAAPGTFQHSVNVGLLADAAARAIHADALLSRIGGLYHDVGKMRAPEYFIENQREHNPHDTLPPWESARILRAHVSNGVDLIRTHRMGARILDFVSEHHGTTTMRVFLERAESVQPPGPIDETYRYAGPRPRSKETAIAMIADQVEATARALHPADEGACGQIVRQTIEHIQAEQQLDDSGLAGRDLQRVEDALARSLSAMYHSRMTYPPAALTPSSPRLRFIPRAVLRGRAKARS